MDFGADLFLNNCSYKFGISAGFKTVPAIFTFTEVKVCFLVKELT
jgi:hypothetical protein